MASRLYLTLDAEATHPAILDPVAVIKLIWLVTIQLYCIIFYNTHVLDIQF